MDVVMQGNHGWIQAVTIDNLMQELATHGSNEANFNGMNAVMNGTRRFAMIVAAMLLLFVLQACLGYVWFSSRGTVVPFWVLPVVGFSGVLLLAFCSFTSMHYMMQRTIEAARANDNAMVELAAAWSRRPENGTLELTFRSGRSFPTYFELSPACARPQPTQALHFSPV